MKKEVVIIEVDDLKDLFYEQLQEFRNPADSETNQASEWLTTNEVLKYLKISKRCWQNYRDKQLIPYYQIGSKIWAKRSELDKFIESGRIGKHELKSKK